jgi:hypothetical protein
MAREIFRKEALQRLASPEQLDQLMPLTSPRAWVALGGLGLLLLVALVWGIFGTLTTTADAQGVLIRRGGVRSVRCPPGGAVVTSVLVHPGDEVEKGRELLRLSAPGGAGATEGPRLLSPCHARVLGVQAREGATAEAGAELLVLEPLDEPFEVLLYVPATDGYKVRAGQKVAVLPAPVPRNEYGYLVGQVTEAARYPAGHDDLLRELGNEELARAMTAGGPCLEVHVALVAAPGTRSGYKWSAAADPPVELTSLMPCQAVITIGERRPIQLLVPGFGGGPGS